MRAIISAATLCAFVATPATAADEAMRAGLRLQGRRCRDGSLYSAIRSAGFRRRQCETRPASHRRLHARSDRRRQRQRSRTGSRQLKRRQEIRDRRSVHAQAPCHPNSGRRRNRKLRQSLRHQCEMRCVQSGIRGCRREAMGADHAPATSLIRQSLENKNVKVRFRREVAFAHLEAGRRDFPYVGRAEGTVCSATDIRSCILLSAPFPALTHEPSVRRIGSRA